MSTQWIARREAVNPRTEEDAAMAHRHLGRFTSFDAAVLGLMDALERERRAWLDLGMDAGADRALAAWTRVAGQRSRDVEATGRLVVEDEDGLRYSLTRVG